MFVAVLPRQKPQQKPQQKLHQSMDSEGREFGSSIDYQEIVLLLNNQS